MNKVLVTGGLGFIGSHTVVELINSDHEVVIADDLSNARIEVLDGIAQITGVRPDFEKIDLTDFEATKALFKKYQLDAIIHFAAKKAVGESVSEPLLYYRTNLTSLINLLELSKSEGVESFVFSSSCTVYGEPDILPVTEETPLKKAESPYGNTKQVGEEIIVDFSKSFSDVRAIALRYFNPVGAHDSALIGELPLGIPNNLVPYITQTAIGIREKLSVFGDDYNTSDGTCVRDYIHVVDLAKAHVKALDYAHQMKQSYDVFNLGTGKGVSVLEVIRSFEKVSDQDLNYEIIGRRPGDVEKTYADTTKANKILGWQAEKSLDDMMFSAWKWQKALSDRHEVV